MSEPGRKMSLTQATMLVAGNMIGTGLFLLPVNLAQVGGIAIFGWVIATVGVAALGLVFAKLGELNPQEGGPYAYARDFLGPYAGFQTNYVYWFGNWIGNIAIAVAAVGYLAELVPGISGPPASVFATAAVIWLLTFANILGPRVVGALETWTMALALIPIMAIALLGWFWFDSETFLAGWNVTGESDMHAVSRAASMALWAYMGIESAAVSAGVIENPKRNVPLATLIGLGLAAVVYMLSSTVIMGILPNEELRTSHAPFAEAARLALGTTGAIIISVCAVLKSMGSLGGWMLLVGQSAKAAADDGMFPRAFARLNGNGVPGRGLIIVAVLMTAVLFATMSPTLAGQFNNLVNLAVILIIVPYIYSAVAVVKVVHDHKLPAKTFQTYKWIAIAAVVYCLWVILGGDPTTVVHAMVALLISVPLYPFFIRSMEAAAKRKAAQAMTTRSFSHAAAFCVHGFRVACSSSCMRSRLRSRWHLRRRPSLARSLRLRPSQHRRPACPRDSTGRSTSTPPSGAFGFADSLYTDPKPEQPSGDLSDNWFEGSIKPALSAEYTTGELRAGLRQVERRRRAHLRRRANAWSATTRPHSMWRTLYIGWRSGNEPRRPRRERARLHGGPHAVQARPRHAAVGRRGGGRFARRLLDQRAQGLRVRRDRPVQARQSHARGVLSRQGRSARRPTPTASSGA